MSDDTSRTPGTPGPGSPEPEAGRGRPGPPPRAGRARRTTGADTAATRNGSSRNGSSPDPAVPEQRSADTDVPAGRGAGRTTAQAARRPRGGATGADRPGTGQEAAGKPAATTRGGRTATRGTRAGSRNVADNRTRTGRARTAAPDDAAERPDAQPATEGSDAQVIPLRAEGERRRRKAAETSTTVDEAMAAHPSAAPPDEGPSPAEETVERLFAFLRRRLDGEYAVDEFGFDPDLTDNVLIPALRPLYRSWFRVETIGMHNVPDVGGALVVANHSGTLPLDSLMTAVALHDDHPAQRHLRMLGADLVFKLPVLGALTRKQGATLACNPDAERLLSSGELVGVWPEGFKGIGKPFRDRYKLQRFGRGGFVSAALKTGVPIIPCAIVGAEEIYPKIGDIKPLARLFGAPYFPVTPTFPLLGPLGAVPLPSKWYIEFGEPIRTDTFDPVDADDPMLVFNLTDQVRETIQHTLYRLLSQRRNAFLG